MPRAVGGDHRELGQGTGDSAFLIGQSGRGGMGVTGGVGDLESERQRCRSLAGDLGSRVEGAEMRGAGSEIGKLNLGAAERRAALPYAAEIVN